MEYVWGVLAGLAFGAAVSLLNYYIAKVCLKKENTNAVISVNFTRNIVDIAALALVFFLRKSLPFSFEATIIATAVALSTMTLIFTFKLGKKL